MGINKVVILTILLLAICSLSCVSASDNVTDDNLEGIAEDINVTYDDVM